MLSTNVTYLSSGDWCSKFAVGVNLIEWVQVLNASFVDYLFWGRNVVWKLVGSLLGSVIGSLFVENLACGSLVNFCMNIELFVVSKIFFSWIQMYRMGQKIELGLPCCLNFCLGEPSSIFWSNFFWSTVYIYKVSDKCACNIVYFS
jgi:hypothetical protein